MAGTLDALFRPRSVAVIGASRERGSVGGEIFHNLLHNGFKGAVYPVNPGAPVVQSVKAYPSVTAIPDAVDLAVVVVPKARVLAVAKECVGKGVKGLVVISAGFGETGPAGRALQDELLALSRGAGMRMVGPNCLGLLNAEADFCLDATFAPTWPPFGNVAFSSQSGALGLAILDYARDLGIGLSHFVSVGNKADVSGNDLLEYWEHDANVSVILFYLESLGHPTRFQTIARRVARKKPIVVVKSGRTAAGARAASSHTGALAGLDVAVDALLGQAGVIRTDTIEELFDLAMLLSTQPVPRGGRVAILTNAGGPGIMCSDACESRGLALAELAPASLAALREFLPPEASLRNPVDMIASASANSYERALAVLLADTGVDAVVVLFVPPIITEATDVAAAILRATAAASAAPAGHGERKPVLTCFMGTHGVPPALSSLRDGKIPSYAFPEAAAIALARATRYGDWLRRPEGRAAAFSDIDEAAIQSARRAAQSERWLDPDEVKALLQAAGIKTPAAVLTRSAEEAASAAKRMGFPVALKLSSATITHKSDVGGVALDLKSAEAVRDAYVAMQNALAARGKQQEMQGALVQQMAPRGVETFVGMTADPSFGPLLGFGIGGISVELWRDIVFRVHPITDVDARDMLAQIRGRALLDGFRGAPAVSREALVETLLRIDALVARFPELVELDLNPLIALPDGALAVDARMRVRPVSDAGRTNR